MALLIIKKNGKHLNINYVTIYRSPACYSKFMQEYFYVIQNGVENSSWKLVVNLGEVRLDER